MHAYLHTSTDLSTCMHADWVAEWQTDWLTCWHTHTYLPTCMPASLHTSVHTYILTYIHTKLLLYLLLYPHTCIHANIRYFIHIHACINTYTCKHRYTLTVPVYIYIYRHVISRMYICIVDSSSAQMHVIACTSKHPPSHVHRECAWASIYTRAWFSRSLSGHAPFSQPGSPRTSRQPKVEKSELRF